jgi:hypothetical protein
MNHAPNPLTRIFKTAWFNKYAKKVSIKDQELCEAAK